MNQSKPNNFVSNVQKPINWYFPTSQNYANTNFNSNSSLNLEKCNTNSVIPTSFTWKPIKTPPYSTLNTNQINQTNLDPVEDMDWSYYEPSYYRRNYKSFMQFFNKR